MPCESAAPTLDYLIPSNEDEESLRTACQWSLFGKSNKRENANGRKGRRGKCSRINCY
jgi:hypothetical protein